MHHSAMNDGIGEVVMALGHRTASAVPWDRSLAMRFLSIVERPEVAWLSRNRCEKTVDRPGVVIVTNEAIT